MGASEASRAVRLARQAGVDPLAGLTQEQLEHLAWDWRFWARPEQLMPPDPWAVWLILAGRGFGKTKTGAEAVREVVASGEVEHVAFVAQTPADARDVMIEGVAGILTVSPPHERPLWEPSKRRLTWPNGAKATVYSGENPEQLRGPQHQLVWVDELCAFAKPDETWSNLSFGTRLSWKSGRGARTIVTTTPKPIKVLKAIMTDPGTVITRGRTRDNTHNLDAVFLQQMKKYEGTRVGRQELDAEVLEEVEGALWTTEMLERTRVRALPDMQRIVVAVDPAATSGANSAETGIVVCGLGVDGDLYVLEDLSCRLRPNGWATRAIEAYERYRADAIVAEVNNGGEMVEEVIRGVDSRPRVISVHAARGKMRRAEPVVSLYEQGRAHHLGTLKELEDQMTSYTGLTGETSPDRMDALVWGAHELAVGPDVVIV